jgi:hypothetical protein
MESSNEESQYLNKNNAAMQQLEEERLQMALYNNEIEQFR